MGSLICYAIYLKTGLVWLLPLSFLGFLINLFNMLPVPPLDGGRITAAISPWMWLPGLLGLVGMIAYEWIVDHWLNYILILVLIFAWPRLRATFLGRDRQHPYYNIGRAATWAMGAAYLGLGLLLVVFTYQTGRASQMLHLFH